jgi:DNA (cytosine-5)-methyltransferase 1
LKTTPLDNISIEPLNNIQEYNQEPLKVFEFFSGIGAQHKALKNIGVEFEIVGTSEWYIDAIIAYSEIHHSDIIIDIPPYEEQIEFLSQPQFVFSSDSKNPINEIKRLSKEKIRQLYIGVKRSKNFGSITNIKGEILPDIDVLTYSFPCTDLSTAGKMRGLTKGSNTRSSLLWEVQRILEELKELNRLPKYLLMENVPTLFEKFKDDYQIWKDVLSNLGYTTHDIIFNSGDFGTYQSRKRAFSVSVLDESEPFEFTSGSKKSQPMSHILDENVDSRFLLKDKRILKLFKEVKNKFINISKSNNRSYGVISYSVPYCNFIINNKIYRSDGCLPTLTTSCKYKIYDTKNDVVRYLTPKEAIKGMGFDDEDYQHLNSVIKSETSQYKMSGNSIVVQVLESIFRDIIEHNSPFYKPKSKKYSLEDF